HGRSPFQQERQRSSSASEPTGTIPTDTRGRCSRLFGRSSPPPGVRRPSPATPADAQHLSHTIRGHADRWGSNLLMPTSALPELRDWLADSRASSQGSRSSEHGVDLKATIARAAPSVNRLPRIQSVIFPHFSRAPHGLPWKGGGSAPAVGRSSARKPTSL